MAGTTPLALTVRAVRFDRRPRRSRLWVTFSDAFRNHCREKRPRRGRSRDRQVCLRARLPPLGPGPVELLLGNVRPIASPTCRPAEMVSVGVLDAVRPLPRVRPATRLERCWPFARLEDAMRRHPSSMHARRQAPLMRWIPGCCGLVSPRTRCFPSTPPESLPRIPTLVQERYFGGFLRSCSCMNARGRLAFEAASKEGGGSPSPLSIRRRGHSPIVRRRCCLCSFRHAREVPTSATGLPYGEASSVGTDSPAARIGIPGVTAAGFPSCSDRARAVGRALASSPSLDCRWVRFVPAVLLGRHTFRQFAIRKRLGGLFPPRVGLLRDCECP